MKKRLLWLIILSCLLSFSLPLPVRTEDNRAIIRKHAETLEQMRTEARTALVIGNGKYKSAPLINPVNDAEAMSKTLSDLGFNVTQLHNLDFAGMNMSIDNFGNTLKKGGVGLFYFAGHGLQQRGNNYLIPVKSNINHENEIKYRAVNAGLVLAKMESAGNRLNIVILDACRNNPFARKFRSSERGLAALTEAPTGSIVAYATAPGRTASDGSGGNGLYTSELILYMQKPGLMLEEVFKKVRKAVRIKTNQKQIPWETTSLEGAFYFKLPEKKSPVLADSSGSFTITPPLTPPPVIKNGRLTVNANAPGAEVSVNGTQYRKTPVNFTIAQTGDYTIKVRAEGYEPYQITKRIEKGAEIAVDAYLEKIIVNSLKPFTTNSIGMKFVHIKPGTFMMGSPDNEKGRGRDEKQHKVTLTRDFYMQTTEVTQGQWKTVMGNNPSDFKNCGNDCPVERVSWNDVQEFIKKLNQKEGTDKYRLPTEAEWEYAARAGSKTAFANGGITEKGGGYDPNLDKMGWYWANSGNKTHSVGQKKANDWGLFNINGNVREWCQDWYGDYSSDSVTDPKGPSSGSGRVFRGGSWSDLPQYCRSAVRYRNDPGHRVNYVGFRLMRIP